MKPFCVPNKSFITFHPHAGPVKMGLFLPNYTAGDEIIDPSLLHTIPPLPQVSPSFSPTLLVLNIFFFFLIGFSVSA